MTTHLIELQRRKKRGRKGKERPDLYVKDALIPGAPQKWVHVCSVTDETRNGEPITLEMLQALVADFNANPEPIPVYIGHQDVERVIGQPEPPASGWTLALDLDDQGDLHALYEQTEDLHTHIKTGGFRFNSICGKFFEDDDGNVTRAEFWSIAVTNSPAVPGLTPMAASHRRGKEGLVMATTIKKVLEGVLEDLPKDASPEQVHALIDAAVAKAQALEPDEKGEANGDTPAPPGNEPTPPPIPTADGTPPQVVAAAEGTEGGEVVTANVEAMAAALQGVAAESGMSVEEVIAMIEKDPAAVAAALTGSGDGDSGTDSPPDSEFFSKNKEVAMARVRAAESRFTESEGQRVALAARVAELEADGREREVDAEIAAGHYLPAQRKLLVATARTDPKLWSMWRDAGKEEPAVPTGKLVVAADPKLETRKLEGVDLAHVEDKKRVIALAVPNPKRRHELHPELFPEPGSDSRA